MNIRDLSFCVNKGFRLLSIYERLQKGETLNKSNLALDYGVTEKTIQRDIENLRIYLVESYQHEIETFIKYDWKSKGYYLVKFEREWFSKEEILVVCKILLESRGLCSEELNTIMDKLLIQIAPKDRKEVEEIILNERFHYVALNHGKRLRTTIWDLSQYIKRNEIIEIFYVRKDGYSREHRVKSVGIMFSEYYFYLIAYMADDSKEFPTIFRIYRIEDIKTTSEKFRIPYKNKFSEGEFRKRVQFMYSGPLKIIRFN